MVVLCVGAHVAYYYGAKSWGARWTPLGVMMDHKGTNKFFWEPQCQCGAERPETRHWAWRCPAFSPNVCRGAWEVIEERLMVPLVPRMSKHLAQHTLRQISRRMADIMEAQREREYFIATDGRRI